MKRSLDKFLESSDVQTAAKPPLITILKCSRERCWTRLSVPLSYVFKNGFLGKRNSSLNTLQSVHFKKKIPLCILAKLPQEERTISFHLIYWYVSDKVQELFFQAKLPSILQRWVSHRQDYCCSCCLKGRFEFSFKEASNLLFS